MMLASVSKYYGLGPVVAIDPHNFNDPEFEKYRSIPDASTYDDFVRNLDVAGVSDRVNIRRAFSSEVAAEWNRPIRFLWIDGDHTYSGAKADFDGFFPHIAPGGVVAVHDALHEYPGPIRVFVENILRSEQFGPAGFVGSIAWSQFRPKDGVLFKEQKDALERVAARLVPLFKDEAKLRGSQKILFKLNRYRVPSCATEKQCPLSGLQL